MTKVTQDVTLCDDEPRLSTVVVSGSAGFEVRMFTERKPKTIVYSLIKYQGWYVEAPHGGARSHLVAPLL